MSEHASRNASKAHLASFGRIVLFQLLLTIFLLVILEAAARLVFTLYAGPLYVGAGAREEWFILSSDVGWDRRPNFNGLDLCGSHRTFDSQGLVSIDAAQLQNDGSKKRRVMFLGDSNTYGHCLTTESTFVEVADRLLPEFDLINLGVPAYTSYQGYKQLLKYGELIRPDIIFISFNFNDRRCVTADSEVDSDAAFKKVARTSTLQNLEYSYLFRLVRAFGKKTRIIKTSADSTAALRLDTLRPRVDLQSYRVNLIRMVDWARQHGSTPYFILLGDNPNHAHLLRRGKDQLERENYEAAIKDLTLITSYSRSALSVLARQYLSIAYRETGRVNQAEQVLWIKPWYSTHGGLPVLQDSDYNKIMRDVAQEYDVTLVDAKSKLNESPRVFFDEVGHFDAVGHEIVGELLRDVLAKAK